MYRKEECTGCAACINICGMDAIHFEVDKEGFMYPKINESLCCKCGKCEMVCPVKRKPQTENEEKPDVYAAWSLDTEIRFESTSGGIFSELAKLILTRCGYICGAAYTDNHMVEHCIVSSEEGVERLRQSKYVQSNIENVYKEVSELLNKQCEVLFCGSPCECAGIMNYLNMVNCSTEDLILVDFVCRGANSPKVYRMFLDELETIYESKVSRVWFKNKKYGWNRFSTKIEFENGNEYLEDRWNDIYIRGYIEKDLYMRPSCTECRFKGFPRVSDITLADFWGIVLDDTSKDSDKGTSMVITNSEKGKLLFEEIKDRIYHENKTLDDASRNNYCMYNSVPFGEHRQEFMNDLDILGVINNIKRFL